LSTTSLSKTFSFYIWTTRNILKLYLLFWVTALVTAIILYIKNFNSFTLSQKDYWYFLLQPWKITTFIIATLGLIIIAPYTGDPTWDYVDALFMSILTFATAPWAIGVIYKAIKKTADLKELYVAICFWLFSASWSYDLYLLLRDGYYPMTWWANLCASSVLYILAGMFWNLNWLPEKGIQFSFMLNDWPNPSIRFSFSKIIWVGLLFMIFVATAILSFL
jgi:hypothetical protein